MRRYGFIISWPGPNYGGGLYVLVRTPDGLTFLVDRPRTEYPVTFFRNYATISFTVEPGTAWVQGIGEPLPKGSDPQEVTGPLPQQPFIRGVISRLTGRGGGAIALEVDGQFKHFNTPSKATRLFDATSVSKERDFSLYVGLPVLLGTHVTVPSSNATIHWPSVNNIIPDDEELRTRATRVTTMAVVTDIQGVFDANFEIGGAPTSGLPYFGFAQECYIPGLKSADRAAGLIAGMLEVAEASYTAEFAALNEEERRDWQHPVVCGERAFRMARADAEHRLRILVNPLNFPNLTPKELTDAANAFMATHDGSEVEGIAVIAKHDHRTEPHNFLFTTSVEGLLRGHTSHLQSVVYVDKMLQFGRLGPNKREWINFRSDTQEKISLRIYGRQAVNQAAFKVYTPPTRDFLPQEQGRTGSVRMSGFRQEAALLASMSQESAQDDAITVLWRQGEGGITRQIPCRTIQHGGPARYVTKALTHATEADREATREALEREDADGLRNFITFPADIFYQPRPDDYYTALVLVAPGTDFNMLFVALGQVHVAPLDNHLFRVDTNVHDKRAFRHALTEANLRLKQGRDDEAFHAVISPASGGYDTSWLVQGPRAHRQASDEAELSGERGYVYLHGFPPLMSVDALSASLSALGLDQTNLPAWVEDPEFTDPLVEVQVDNASRFEGFDRVMAAHNMKVCAVDRRSCQMEGLQRTPIFGAAPLAEARRAPAPKSVNAISAKQRKAFNILRTARAKTDKKERQERIEALGPREQEEQKGRGLAEAAAEAVAAADAMAAELAAELGTQDEQKGREDERGKERKKRRRKNRKGRGKRAKGKKASDDVSSKRGGSDSKGEQELYDGYGTPSASSDHTGARPTSEGEHDGGGNGEDSGVMEDDSGEGDDGWGAHPDHGVAPLALGNQFEALADAEGSQEGGREREREREH